MRILIDECLDWRLCSALSEYNCASVQQMGWGGFSNGLLLQKAQEEFDVLLTGDANLSFQQNVTSFNIAVVVLEAGSTRLAVGGHNQINTGRIKALADDTTR